MVRNRLFLASSVFYSRKFSVQFLEDNLENRHMMFGKKGQMAKGHVKEF